MGKLREMNFTDKRQYIWEYYKLHIIFTAMGLFMIGSLINVWFINPPLRDHLYIAWQAFPVHSDTLEEISEELSVIVYDQDRYRVSVRSYVLTDDMQIDQAIITRFHALLSVGDIHALITTREDIQDGAEFGLLRPMTEVLAIIQSSSPSLYEEISGRLLTVTYTDMDSEYTITDVMGIDLSGAPLLLEHGLTMGDMYLAVIINSEHFEELAQALAVIFRKDFFRNYE